MQQNTFFLNLYQKLSCQKISKQFFVYFQENIKTSKQQDQKLLCMYLLSSLTHDFHCWEVVCVEVKTALDKSISTVITHCANAINFLASSLAP